MGTNSSSNKRIAKNTLMLYMRMLFTMAVSLYTSRVVLNTLGVEDFGIYNVVAGLVSMFAFLNGAMSASTSRFITFELGRSDFLQLNKVFNASIVNHVLIAFIILVFAETIGLWFVKNKLVFPEERMSSVVWVYQISILSIMITLLRTPFNAVIIAYERMKVYAYISILDACLKLIIVFLLVLFDFDKLILYSLLLLLVTIITTSSYIIYVLNRFETCKLVFQKDLKLHKELLSYSGWDLIGNFSVIAQGQGINMLLNIFFGPTVNAARGIAYQVQGAISQFSGNFMLATRPQIIKNFAEGHITKMMNLVFRSSRYSFYLLWIFILPLLFRMDYVLLIWLKLVPDNAVVFTQLVLIIALVMAWRNPFIAAMHATGKIKIPNIVCGSILISALPISYLILKLGFEAYSVFVVTIIISFITLWVEWVLIKRAVYFSIKLAFKNVVLISILVSILSGLITMFLNSLIPQSGFLSLLVFSALSLIGTVLSIYLIGIDSSERAFFNNKFKSILHL